jgi:hypothetical protein
MKKFVLASSMVLVSLALVNTPALRAQNSGQLTIQDPAEFNAYQTASTQTDPAAKALALEAFLTQYPQSVVKNAVLDQLMDAYQATNSPDKELSAASRLLQIDPNNMKATFMSVYIKKSQCGTTSDVQTCDDAGALAQKGLTLPKPAAMADSDYKKMTDATYPIYHSAIALDDVLGKKDDAAAIKEYKTELMMYSDAQTKTGPGLVDTLALAEVYAKQDVRDMVLACWFYARAWNFAPPAYKAQIEPKLEYWYKRYHGNLDGIDAVKTQSATTLFPPSTFAIEPAPTPDKLAHAALVGGDPMKLNLEDKEYILANGNKADADTLWNLVKDQPTPVPGIVISDPATALKVTVTGALATAKPKEYVVKLNTPGPCAAVPAAPSELKVQDAQAYLTANGAAADVSAIDGLDKAKKVLIEPAVTAISLAVTQDAKDSKRADFNVKLKEALTCKDAPAVGFEMKTQPAEELDAVYDTYTTTPAAGTTPASALIVLRDGFVQMEKKATAPVHHAAPARPHHGV